MQKDSWCLRLMLASVSAFIVLGGGSGCYYAHLASGQLKLLSARESIEDVQSDPASPDRLREQLELVGRAREFAKELGLEVGGRYTSYVDWPGDRVVTTVVASRPGEVEARNFDFPIVGQVPYKGFFDLADAEHEADALRAEGLDVCLIAVSAYSTLGWIDDPVTAPMLLRDDTHLVETVVHELVHATVFVASQPEFNEGVARFIGQEAAVRFFAGEPERASEARDLVWDDRTLARELLGFRRRVADLYARDPQPADPPAERLALETRFRDALADVPLRSRDAARLAERVRLNDACLAIGGTYAEDTPLHASLLRQLQDDLQQFVRRLREAVDQDDPRAWFFGSQQPGRE